MALEEFTGELDEETVVPQEAPQAAPAPEVQQVPPVNVASFSGELDAAEATVTPETPDEPSTLDVVKSFVMGVGRRDPNIPELNTFGLPLQNASPEQQLELLRQEESIREQHLGALARDIKPGGLDEYGNPVVLVDGKPNYINAPGVSFRDVEDAKQMLPELMVSLATPLKGALLKSLTSVGLTAAANKLSDTLSVDERTGIERGLRDHARLAATEGGIAAAGEGVGRLATFMGRTVTEAAARVWKRQVGGHIPHRWVRKDGTLTREAAEGFRKAGISDDDILPEVMAALKDVPTDIPTADIAARAAEADAAGIPLTVADLTLDPTTKAAERRLLQGSTQQGGDAMRQAAADYTQAAVAFGERIAPKRSHISNFKLGKKVRNTLFLTKEREGRAAGELYDAARAAVGSHKALTRLDPIVETLEAMDMDTRHLMDEREVMMSMKQIFQDYGIIGDPDAARFEYTVGTSENLIQRLNELASSPSVRRKGTDGLVNKMKHTVLDHTANAIDTELRHAPSSVKKLQMFQKARANWAQYMKNWQSADIVDDLLAQKTFQGGALPKISDSDVLKKVKSANVEDAQRLVRALNRGGQEGVDTLKDLRASMMASILEDSIEDGIVPVLNTKFLNKALSAYPEGTLDAYFTPAQMKQLRLLHRISDRRQMKGVGTVVADDHVSIEVAQRVLGSVWLFRHSPTVATAVATGKVAQKQATQKIKRKAVEYQLGGVKSLQSARNIPKSILAEGSPRPSFKTSSQSQRQLQQRAVMIAGLESRFPKLAALLTGRGARSTVKLISEEQARSENVSE